MIALGEDNSAWQGRGARLRASRLDQLLDPEAFLWSTGIEDTFILDPWPKTGRTLDEYELTGHYVCAEDDIRLIAELGVPVARYGIPWHRINPAPGKWEWEWTDRSLNLLLELEIEPVVDLVHYGVPGWIKGAFLNPDFPARMAEYAARVAERFVGRIFAYTPLNEPRITAWYCGKLGWWPPYEKGWRGFARVILAICRGIVETVSALREVDSEIVPVHVDATDIYETADPDLQPEVSRRQEIVFLALDLISGRLVADHPLRAWLSKLGVTDEEFAWFEAHALDLPLIGINIYPMFSRKVLVSSPSGVRIRMPYGSGEIIERIATLYWRRYERPLFITETAAMGSINRRRAWLDSSIGAVERLRSRGVPVIGYTWWPMLAMVTWAYRQGNLPSADYLKEFGLWDLETSPGELRRVKTPLAGAYHHLVARGCAAVGKLERARQEA